MAIKVGQVYKVLDIFDTARYYVITSQGSENEFQIDYLFDEYGNTRNEPFLSYTKTRDIIEKSYILVGDDVEAFKKVFEVLYKKPKPNGLIDFASIADGSITTNKIHMSPSQYKAWQKIMKKE